MRAKKEINIQIGEQVKQAREHAKLTQEQLAERIEVSPQYVSDLERGVVGISNPTLKKLCVTLCISSDQILFSHKKNSYTTCITEKCTQLSEQHLRLLAAIIDKYVEAVEYNQTQ